MLTLKQTCAFCNAYPQKDNISSQELFDQLKLWYNGFCFSNNGEKVYNPFSILNCLQQHDFRNYWFASGTPMFIVKFAERNPEMVQKLMTFETGELTVNDLEKLSVESYFKNTLVIFQQAGYLIERASTSTALPPPKPNEFETA